MGEKGWNGCRSSCRGTSLRGRFPHGSGNGDDSRRDMRQTHCAAKPNAARCDERCSALRWTMHCTTSFHPSHSHEARRTQQPNPTAAHRSAKTTPLLPVHTIGTLPLTPKRHLWIRLLGTARQTAKRNTRNPKTGRSGPRSRTKKDVRQDGAAQKTERRKMCNRMERPKRLNEGNRTTGWGEPRERTKKDVRQDGAGQKTERRKQDDRMERAKRPNEERHATGRNGPKERTKNDGCG